MNGAYWHLVWNHVPVVALPFVCLLLLLGIARKSRELIQVGLMAVVLVAVLTIPAFKSGDPAAEVVRDLPGVSRADIHEHEEAGEAAFAVVEALGVLAIVGLWYQKRQGNLTKVLPIAVLVGSMAASGWLGWVAHLGGLIRHPEIRSGGEAVAASREEH